VPASAPSSGAWIAAISFEPIPRRRLRGRGAQTKVIGLIPLRQPSHRYGGEEDEGVPISLYFGRGGGSSITGGSSGRGIGIGRGGSS
jgi:hypothetical protein